MSVDPEMIAATREWLDYAVRDLQSVEALLASEHELYENVLFHVQQAMEKSLKAVLYWHNVVFDKIHDLAKLSQQVIQVEPSLRGVLAGIENYTSYATLARYPPEPYSQPPVREDAERAETRAWELLKAVCRLLPNEAHPTAIDLS